MTIPHTNQGRKAFLAKLNEKRFRKKTKDGKTGPWMERKLECKVGAIDSHVFGYCLSRGVSRYRFLYREVSQIPGYQSVSGLDQHLQ